MVNARIELILESNGGNRVDRRSRERYDPYDIVLLSTYWLQHHDFSQRNRKKDITVTIVAKWELKSHLLRGQWSCTLAFLGIRTISLLMDRNF